MDLGRYLATDGEMGSCPDWYAYIQAAKYLNVRPDELMRMPLYWRSKALKSMDAEARAQKIREAHEESKRRSL